MKDNLTWQKSSVDYSSRCRLLGQQGMVVWLTGLPASGKSTIADELEKLLHQQGFSTYLLDGDNMRHGLSAGLGFGDADRIENLRRVAEVAALFRDAGIVTIVACISPFAESRRLAREKAGSQYFIEVYVKADLEICQKRDPKALYQKSNMGEIHNFTGISSCYEEPEDPDIKIDTGVLSIEESVDKIYRAIISKQPDNYRR